MAGAVTVLNAAGVQGGDTIIATSGYVGTTKNLDKSTLWIGEGGLGNEGRGCQPRQGLKEESPSAEAEKRATASRVCAPGRVRRLSLRNTVGLVVVTSSQGQCCYHHVRTGLNVEVKASVSNK